MRDEALNDHALQCMEIIGGNRALRQTIAAPGLDIWIDSRPLELGAGGGDVHYISTCAGGYVTRLALADIAGHGKSADALALILRNLMRKCITVRLVSASSYWRLSTCDAVKTGVADDQTLIVIKHAHTSPPRASLRLTARTLAKIIGLSRV